MMVNRPLPTFAKEKKRRGTGAGGRICLICDVMLKSLTERSFDAFHI